MATNQYDRDEEGGYRRGQAQRENATIPANQTYPGTGLEIDFLGLPMVFNDGKAENHLAIALTNNNFFGALQAQDSNIVFTRNNPISIWFVVDVEQASAAAERPWALTTNDALHDEKVTLTAKPGNWDVRRSDDLSGTPLYDSLKGWRLTAREDLTLLPGQSLVLTLSGFTSTSPDGPTSGYVQVDMPHLDNSGNVSKSIMKIIGPITKSRIMITGERMGIGTGTPNSALEVNGAVQARSGDPDSHDINNNGFFFKGTGDADSGMTSLGNGNLTLYTEGFKAFQMFHQIVSVDSKPLHWVDFILAGNLTVSTLDGKASGLGGVMKVQDIEVEGNIKSNAGRFQDVSGDVMPVGAIIAYGGNMPPKGWLLCDGSELPNYANYNNLRAVVGNSVPDLRDRFVIGAGPWVGGRGNTGGDRFHTLSWEEMPSHSHPIQYADSQKANNGYIGDFRKKQPWFIKVSDLPGGAFYNPLDPADERTQSIQPAGQDQPHNNMPPYYALTYIIKY